MYVDADDIKDMAEKIIDAKEELDHIRLLDINIGFLYSDKEKKAGGNLVFADCTKVNGLLSHYCPYDFIITVYEPNIIELSDAQLQVLIYHELLHIGTDGKLKGHNVRDFYVLLQEYGLDWIETDIEPIIGGD